MDFYGCRASPRTMECEAPWSYYFLLLKNVTSARHAKKQAGADGWARIRIAARPGDSLFFSGQDAYTRAPSWNKFLFTISSEGEAQWVGEMIRNDELKMNDFEKATMTVAQVPVVGSLLGGIMLMFVQFDHAMRRPQY